MTVPQAELAPGVMIPRVIVGGWQLSPGHSARSPDHRAILQTWGRLADRGLTAFDCADIYQGVEQLLGAFLRSRRDTIRVHTKLVPDRGSLPTLTRTKVEQIVDRSLRRLRVDRLDLVQFHWWDFGIPGWIEAIGWLEDLMRLGKIRDLGLTNFDAPRLDQLIVAGAPIASIQLQYSVLDRRPERAMAALCRQHGVAMLCYGTVAGGFLADRWLGAEAPAEPLENRSLVKYRLIIDECGGWPAYRKLLGVLGRVARRHRSDLAAIASRWVLDQPGVTAVIIGVRSGDHLDALERLASLELTETDRADLDRALAGLPCPTGDVYGLERDPEGRHAGIMRYDLHRDS